MTYGERFVASITLKTSFYDAHEQRAYQRLVKVAARVIDDASLIERGRNFLNRFVRDDPHQRRAYETWDQLLRQSPEHIVRELLADSVEGQTLRDTAPVFVALPAPRTDASQHLA